MIIEITVPYISGGIMSAFKSFLFVLFFSVGSLAVQPQELIENPPTEGTSCEICEAKNAYGPFGGESENVINPLGDLLAEFERGKLLAAETLKSEKLSSGVKEDRFKYFLLIDGRKAVTEEGFLTYLKVMSEISGKSIKQLQGELKKAKISTYELKSYFLSASILSGKSLEEIKDIYQSAKPRESWVNASLTAIAAVKGKPMAVVEAQYEDLKKKIKVPETRILLMSAASFSDQSLDEVIAMYNKIKSPKLAGDKARLAMLATLSNKPVDQAVNSYKKHFEKAQAKRNAFEVLAGLNGDAMVEVAAALFGKKTPSMAQYAKLDEMVTLTITGDSNAIISILGFDSVEGGGGGGYGYNGFVHPNGMVYYRNGRPYGGTVYYDPDGRAYDRRPTVGDTLVNRVREKFSRR